MTRPAIFLAGCALCVMACGATFTLPAFDQVPQGCGADTVALVDLAFVRVNASRQSPTWLVKRDSMLAYPASWARWWPVVRAEAEPVVVSRTPVPADSAGRRYLFTPATMWRPVFVRVATEDLDGNVSCPSNWLGIE